MQGFSGETAGTAVWRAFGRCALTSGSATVERKAQDRARWRGGVNRLCSTFSGMIGLSKELK